VKVLPEPIDGIGERARPARRAIRVPLTFDCELLRSPQMLAQVRRIIRAGVRVRIRAEAKPRRQRRRLSPGRDVYVRRMAFIGGHGDGDPKTAVDRPELAPFLTC
jgi:hypothetical protein